MRGSAASDARRQLLRYGHQTSRPELLGVPGRSIKVLFPWLSMVGAAIAATLAGVVVAAGLHYSQVLVVLATVLLLMPLAIIALGGIKRFLLAAIVIDLAFSIDSNLFYQAELGDLGSLGGLSISLGTLALAALYAMWIVELLISNVAVKRPRTNAFSWPVIYVAVVAISTVYAADRELASFELLLLLEMLLLLVYFVFKVREKSEILFVVSILFVGLAIQGLITVYSAVSRQIFDLNIITNYVDPSYRQGTFWRSGGTLGSPNTASGFFSMLLAPALAVAAAHRKSLTTTLAICGLGIGFIALIFTKSRGGWVAFAVAAALVVGGLAIQGRLRPATLVTLVAAFVLFAPLTIPLVLDRAADDGGALASRVPLNVISWRMISRNPIMGVGPNNFALTAPSYITPDVSEYWFYTVHNKYLLVWAESGTLTLVAFLAFLLSSLRLAWQVMRERDLQYRLLALGIGAAIVGHMIHFGFDIFNSRTSVQTLWILVALLAAMAAQGRTRRHTRAKASTSRHAPRCEALRA